MLELSAPPNLKGFKYIKEAIYISINDQTNNIKMHKGLYSYLSKKYNTSTSAIESAIRRLVNKVTEELPYEERENSLRTAAGLAALHTVERRALYLCHERPDGEVYRGSAGFEKEILRVFCRDCRAARCAAGAHILPVGGGL